MNLKKYKILLEGFQPMDNVFECPECGKTSYRDKSAFKFLGWGDFPKATWRGVMKPNSKGIGIECNSCFIKLCHHPGLTGLECSIQMYLDMEELLEKKKSR